MPPCWKISFVPAIANPLLYILPYFFKIGSLFIIYRPSALCTDRQDKELLLFEMTTFNTATLVFNLRALSSRNFFAYVLVVLSQSFGIYHVFALLVDFPLKNLAHMALYVCVIILEILYGIYNINRCHRIEYESMVRRYGSNYALYSRWQILT